jgi:hypothetical protein
MKRVSVNAVACGQVKALFDAPTHKINLSKQVTPVALTETAYFGEEG